MGTLLMLVKKWSTATTTCPTECAPFFEPVEYEPGYGLPSRYSLEAGADRAPGVPDNGHKGGESKIGAMRVIKKIDPDFSVTSMSGNGKINPTVNARERANLLRTPVGCRTILGLGDWAFKERLNLVESRALPGDVVKSSSFCGIIGKSPKIRRVFELIERVSHTDATIFITGETGVGKELIARAIHNTGPRSSAPFVAINCGALAETLLESELFGHEKGAFTGAVKSKEGKFECAHGGTLFLDEIGDVSPAMQVKLLRALQEKRVERVGSNHPIHVDVRVISATNQNIKEKLKIHEFRLDLFYRLNVIPIQIPPLRERIEDIPLLGQHFLARMNDELGRRIKGISPSGMEQLMDYHWPGNVRELENVIERACITCDGDVIDYFSFLHHWDSASVQEVTEKVSIDMPFHSARDMVLRRFERAYLCEALKRYEGNISLIAQKTGINPRTLWRKINEYSLDRRSFKRK